MGAVEATMFAQEGARVVFGDILDEMGQQVEANIRKSGGQATYVHLDVTQEEDWQGAVNIAMSEYGRLDILVNNAGIVPKYGRSIGVEDITDDEWKQVMDINAKGAFLGTKYAIPIMRASGGGSIVNISSGAGIVPSPETPASYAASKGATRLFTKSTAIQYAHEKIRCNSVHPGLVSTPMLQGAGAANPDRVSRVPLGRIGTPEEIAYGVLYLASDESSFVTGTELIIDGGRTAQ
jgi:NAD(P)-dependent dehydrogenase (short-subunit alcohol dehydrogenase family)